MKDTKGYTDAVKLALFRPEVMEGGVMQAVMVSSKGDTAAITAKNAMSAA